MCDPSTVLGCLELSLAAGEAQGSLPQPLEGGCGSVGLLLCTVGSREQEMRTHTLFWQGVH